MEGCVPSEVQWRGREGFQVVDGIAAACCIAQCSAVVRGVLSNEWYGIVEFNVPLDTV